MIEIKLVSNRLHLPINKDYESSYTYSVFSKTIENFKKVKNLGLVNVSVHIICVYYISFCNLYHNSYYYN